MNYLKELNTFHEWLDTNPLPSGAIVLWYALMAINNKTNWQDEFTVANATLQAKTGLSRQQLHRARTDLINVGRIQYKKSNRVNQAGKYSIVSFDTRAEHKADTKEYTSRAQSGQELNTLVRHKQDVNETNYPPHNVRGENDTSNDTKTEREFEPTILEKYMQFRAQYFQKGGFQTSPTDQQAAKELYESGIPLDDALYWLEKRFETYTPKHSRDSINSLGYCVGFILDRYHEEQEKQSKVTQISQAQDKQSDQQQYNYGF
ncbi:hypothetical protein [Alkalibacillus almallahensis]|uniref:hypothetical protein n=1 Tax=Alkalibacillus almallahensis TaxID=1379154 RepID=UPI0014236A9C|nr:hypothetical protein [Alkalibacillus almallahensis]NIK11167.1 hypothetical protein [Alkalibacillus almallahensis]